MCRLSNLATPMTGAWTQKGNSPPFAHGWEVLLPATPHSLSRAAGHKAAGWNLALCVRTGSLPLHSDSSCGVSRLYGEREAQRKSVSSASLAVRGELWAENINIRAQMYRGGCVKYE